MTMQLKLWKIKSDNENETDLTEELVPSESTEPRYPGHLLWAAHPPDKPT